MNSTFRIAALAIAVLFALSACSLMQDRPYSPALHDFGSSRNVTGCAADGSLAIYWSTVSVEAPEWLQNENIRYRLLYIDPTRVHFYAQDRWLAIPSALLAQRLSLTGCNQGLQLKIKLLEFEQVFDEPEKARAILVFRASAQWPDSEKIVGEKVFSLSKPSPTANAKGAITASVLMVDDAVTLLQDWFAKLH